MARYQTDVVIIGAGPVGLFAVAQLGIQTRLKAHVIDSLDKPGGQPAELYPDKPIYDIPAIPVITGQGLTDALMEQCKPFAPTLHLGEKVEPLRKTPQGKWLVSTDAGSEIEAAAIIVASGRGLFDPRKPRIDGLAPCEDVSVFYAVRRGVRDKLQGKRLLIAGGGDSALDWTMALSEEASAVTLIHRRDGFRAAGDTVEKVQALVRARKINFLIAEAVGLTHDDGVLRAVTIKTKDGARYEVASDYFLPFFGMTPKLGALADWDLEMEGGKIKIATKDSATSVPGIFAIGDGCAYEG
ncbi:MAG: NAD(P)/FAD-dependent oxidoreductase, partial [Caulobacterales bacterium]|nr:NAD(P)/FAD-dependent oxidoreductase [Caulobacterales bacterium]